MRRTLVGMAIALLLLLLPAALFAGEVVVVKGADIGPYEDALKGFKAVCKASTAELDGSALGKSELLAGIYKTKPRLVLAIGNTALYKVMAVEGIPVIYAMVSNPETFLTAEKGITGVSMTVPIRRQLEEFLRVSPNARSVGAVYDPVKSGALAREAREAAAALGVAFVAREIRSPKEAAQAIDDLEGSVDAFLMLPDTTALTETTLEYLFLVSHKSHIPVIAFSEKYLKAGAFMAVSIDAADIGRQAGEMAKQALGGVPVDRIPPADPRAASVSINVKTAKRFSR
jgi:putative ABC transport system substrate-binding protein